MCAGNPSGVTRYEWAPEVAGRHWNEPDPRLTQPSKEARLKFDCAHCGSVNRWMAGDRPPTKCRQCGAPEKA